MYSDGDTPKGWVAPFGYPRIKACSRLPMAFRSVPRPSSPPGAKASTECPSYAPYQTPKRQASSARYLSQPCTETIANPQTPDNRRRTPETQPMLLIVYSARQNASEHCRHIRWDDPRRKHRDPFRSDKSPNAATDPPRRSPNPRNRAGPNHHRVVLRAQRRTRTRFTRQKNKTHGQHRPPHALGSKPAPPIRNTSYQTPNARLRHQKTRRPTPGTDYGDYRIRTDDPLLAKQVLYQLS